VPLPPDEGWTGAGSGFALHGAALAGRLQDRLRAVLPDVPPRADFIARLAARVFARGGGIAPEDAHPLYLRDKVALKSAERA
jgi:tRNA threonylcarbamoyladenosine biosynthesis protein TsaB